MSKTRYMLSKIDAITPRLLLAELAVVLNESWIPTDLRLRFAMLSSQFWLVAGFSGNV